MKEFNLSKIREKSPVKDSSGLKWGQYREMSRTVVGGHPLVLLTLESGLVASVLIDEGDKIIQKYQFGWLEGSSGVDLPNHWQLSAYNACTQDQSISISSMVKCKRDLSKVKHEMNYLIDIGERSLAFNYIAEDAENIFSFRLRSEHPNGYLNPNLTSTITNRSKVTGDEFIFSFNVKGILTSIEHRKGPVENFAIFIKPGTHSQQGEDLGREIDAYSHGRSIDMGDEKSVAMICQEYLGVSPKKGSRVTRLGIPTQIACGVNMFHTLEVCQINPRSLLLFTPSTIGRDLRAFG